MKTPPPSGGPLHPDRSTWPARPTVADRYLLVLTGEEREAARECSFQETNAAFTLSRMLGRAIPEERAKERFAQAIYDENIGVDGDDIDMVTALLVADAGFAALSKEANRG